MKNYLSLLLTGKKVLILGYGKEGHSTLNFLNNISVDADITVSDFNPNAFVNDALINETGVKTISGDDYLDSINQADIIIKSPGIKLNREDFNLNKRTLTSQTDLFLAVYGRQITGITGTKGKSTTASLIAHILKSYYPDTLFGGNIGIPLFDLLPSIKPESKIVCELSSHQLEFVRHSPHIAILLNLFQEHLDHYKNFEEYQKAKYNIAVYQKENDHFIYNSNDPLISALVHNFPVKGEKIPLSPDLYKILPEDLVISLPGAHNRFNAEIAAAATVLQGVPVDTIIEAIQAFKPLSHRMEFLGTFKSVRYYNDSISTIPEAAIAAIESLKPVDTIILGGFDRGIDYSILAEYLKKGNVRNVVTTGPAGLHIFNMISEIEAIEELHYFDKFDAAVKKAIELTPQNGICLLSPAASSYNEFVNFEARGKRFMELVKEKNE